jgi:alkaline phosphatase
VRPSRLTRLIPAAAVVGVTAAVAVPNLAAGQDDAGPDATRGDGHQAKNIILLIGDGMGVTHIDAARERYDGAAGELHMEQLRSQDTVRTWSVEPNSSKPNYVTDSASAATAWSSGVRRTTPPSARTPAARSSRR